MKNSRTMLALFVVAALAMVSVAGVAVASEKVDAELVDGINYVPNVTISRDSVEEYGVYKVQSEDSFMKILDTAKYSGKVRFGTFDKYTNTIEPKVIVELTDASNIRLDYDPEYELVVISGETTGTIKVTKGIVQFGYIQGGVFHNFNGKASGNTATVEITNANYFTILAGGAVDQIGGSVEQGDKQEVDKNGNPVFNDDGTPKLVPAVVKLEGNAILTGDYWDNGYYFLDLSGVKFIIAEGATLTGDGKAEDYLLIDGNNIAIELDDLAAGCVQRVVATLTDKNGNVVAEGDAVSDGVLNLTVDYNWGILLSKEYTLTVFYTEEVAGEEDDPTTYNDYYYSGKLTFTPKFDSNNVFNGVFVNLTGGITLGKLPASAFKDATPAGFKYDPAVYRILHLEVDGAAASINDNGTVTATLADGTHVFAVFQKKADKTMYVYSADVTDGVDDAIVFGTSDNVGKIAAYKGSSPPTNLPALIHGVSCVPEDVVDFEDYAEVAAQDEWIILNEGAVMDVDGRLFMKYTSEDSYAEIWVDNVGNNLINVKGIIEYQTGSDIAPLTYTDGTYTYGINAAHYMTGTASPYTHYYTTLDKAMPESSEIKIFGVLKVLKDTTIDGKAAEGNTISVMSDSTLEIGQVSKKLGDITAIATVPKKTTFITDEGRAVVVNGQLKIEDEVDDRGIEGIVADVFYVSAPYGIYTDLVTALDNAKSGDTVTVRPVGDITVGRNAEVKEGVTLDATNQGGYIIVDSGVVFTMSGTMSAIGITVMGAVTGDAPLDAGKLLLKSVNLTAMEGIGLIGVVEFAASFDNTTDANKDKFDVGSIGISGSDDAPSVIKIDGKLAYDLNKIGGNPETSLKMIVAGTAKLKVDYMSFYSVLEVTGNVIFEKASMQSGTPLSVAFDEIIATGSAKIVPASDENATGIVFVNVRGLFGTAANTLTQSVNGVDAKVYLDDDAYAIVYGEAAKVIVKAVSPGTVESTQFIIKVDQQSKVLYQTVYASNENYLMKPLPTVEVTGYLPMSSWYQDFECTVFVAYANCGEYGKLYAGAEKLRFTVTLEAQKGVKWRVDGVDREGNIVLEYGEHRVSIVSEKGYDVSKVTLSKDGGAYTADSRFTLGSDAVFKATAPAVSEDKSAFGLIEILLIIITIVIVIMVIIIAMKFMRS